MRARRRSKLYPPNNIGIMISEDGCHKNAENGKVEETKIIQERKQIDNMLHQVVKERMFGNLLSEDSRLSNSGFLALKKICRDNINSERQSLMKTLDLKKYHTIDNSEEIVRSKRKVPSHKLIPSQDHSLRSTQQQMEGSTKLSPKLQRFSTILKRGANSNHLRNINSTRLPPKKLQIDEKTFSQYFRKITLNQTQIIYDIKVTKEQIVNKYKPMIDARLLQKFLHFFNFPSVMTYRQYISNIQNAINSELRFIYFFVFSLVDESGNGFLTISDLFRFMQQFSDNTYVEEEVYLLAHRINSVSLNLQQMDSKHIEPTFQEVLLVNKTLKLEQLKDLLKEGSKDRISVTCVKSTCYHHTILSLEHDPLERIKKYQIQDTENASKKQKSEKEAKTMFQDGIRFRDFPKVFMGRRPKIFCMFIGVLADEKSWEYE